MLLDSKVVQELALQRQKPALLAALRCGGFVAVAKRINTLLSINDLKRFAQIPAF